MSKNQIFGTKNEKNVQSKPYNRFFLKKKHFFVGRHEKKGLIAIEIENGDKCKG